MHSWNPIHDDRVREICKQNIHASFLTGQSREQALLAGDLDRYLELEARARTTSGYRTDLSLVLGQFPQAEQSFLQRVLPGPGYRQRIREQSGSVEDSPIMAADVAVIHGRLDVLTNLSRIEEGHIYAAVKGSLNRGQAFNHHLPELQLSSAYDVAIGRCDGPMLTDLYVSDLPLVDADFASVMDKLVAEDLAPYIEDAELKKSASYQCSRFVPYYLALLERQIGRERTEFTSRGSAIFRAAGEATKHLHSKGAQTEPGLTMNSAAAYLSLLPANQELVDAWIQNGLGNDLTTAPISAYEPLRSLARNWKPSQDITIDYAWYRETERPFAEFVKAQVEQYLGLDCSLEDKYVQLRCAARGSPQQ